MVGSPLVNGAAVQALVVDQVKGEKLIHFVKRRRKHGLAAQEGPPPAADAGGDHRDPALGGDTRA